MSASGSRCERATGQRPYNGRGQVSRIAHWTFVLLAVVATNAGAQARRPLEDDTARVRLEAINLLQNQDTTPFLDTTRLRLVAKALQTIRRQLPQLADIPAGPDRSFLMLFPHDSVQDVFVKRSGAKVD